MLIVLITHKLGRERMATDMEAALEGRMSVGLSCRLLNRGYAIPERESSYSRARLEAGRRAGPR